MEVDYLWLERLDQKEIINLRKGFDKKNNLYEKNYVKITKLSGLYEKYKKKE